MGATEEIFEITEQQSSVTPELVARKIDVIKSQILTSLPTNTHISPLHAKVENLAVSAENLLYSYHLQFELSLDIKMQIGQAVSQWHDIYLESEYGNDIPTGTEERE